MCDVIVSSSPGFPQIIAIFMCFHGMAARSANYMGLKLSGRVAPLYNNLLEADFIFACEYKWCVTKKACWSCAKGTFDYAAVCMKGRVRDLRRAGHKCLSEGCEMMR